MNVEEITSHVCQSCLGANLLEEIKIARCSKCEKMFCIHFASNIDPQYCIECLSDVSMTREVVVKTYQHYNEETDVITEYKRKAREIRLDGLDWLFYQRKIKNLTDDELELAIEYHRGILNGMLKEREERRIAHAHRYAGIKVVPAHSASSTTTTTTVKKSRTISSNKAQATANGIIQSLLASGKSMEEIQKMIQGMIQGVK